MQRQLTKAELEAQLAGKQADIEARLEALKGEAEGAAEDAQKIVSANPYLIAGGAAVLGILAGWYFTGRRRRKRERRLARAHNLLVEKYMDALSAVVQVELGRGKNIEDAIRSAMRNHLPLIVVESGDTTERDDDGVLKNVFTFVLKTGLGFASKVLMDQIQDRLQLEQQLDKFLSSARSAPDTSSFASDSSEYQPEGVPARV
jgi:hypothetical protein